MRDSGFGTQAREGDLRLTAAGPLAGRIAERIRTHGHIGLDEYMRAALLDEQHGYYAVGNPLGRDFTTAPEISQMFGELLGLWCAEMWRRLGRPAPLRLVEAGPGRGTLMRDALRAIGTAAPDFAAAVEVHLVEASAGLRRVQAETLHGVGAAVHWHETVEEVPAGAMLAIANEFFDALPVRQFQYGGQDGGQGWFERRIGLAEDGGFAFCLAPAAEMEAHLFAAAKQPASGEIVELCPEAERIARHLGARLQRHGGAALIVDYGSAEQPSGGSFGALRRGGAADPLDAPGKADLSAWVDFRALGQAARKGGAAVFGPVAQGSFLRRLGIAERAARLNAPAADLQRLVDPQAMGAVFKALALVAPQAGDRPPAGFLESERA